MDENPGQHEQVFGVQNCWYPVLNILRIFLKILHRIYVDFTIFGGNQELREPRLSIQKVLLFKSLYRKKQKQ